MFTALAAFAALGCSGLRLREEQQVLSLHFPLPNDGVKEAADDLGLMVQSIAMPDAIPKVRKFFQNVGLDKVGTISPGVLRSTLDLKKLKAEGRVSSTRLLLI